MTATATRHIWLDERGIAWVDDSGLKVLNLAIGHVAHGWSASELNEQYPEMSMAQIYAALSYYHDHRHELDAQAAKELEDAEQLRAKLGPTPLEKDLAANVKRAA